MTTAPVVLVLASGRGERFKASGSAVHKLDALLLGKAVLEHTLDAVRTTGLPYHVERGNHAGMGDCIAAAVAATRSSAGWLVLPGDMPLICPEIILMVADAMTQFEIAVPTFQSRRGHPVGFPKICQESLLSLGGDVGAKKVMQKFPNINVPIDHMAHGQSCLIDVDTLKDLAFAAHWLSKAKSP